jgi:hypothetical protein
VVFGPRPEEVGKSLGATEIKLSINYEPVAFAQMVAKIGYAYACAERATSDLYGDSFIAPAIIGVKDDIGRWVGTITKPVEVHPNHLHRILLHQDYVNGLLVAEVQLFSDSQTPSYGVIIGKLKQATAA